MDYHISDAEIVILGFVTVWDLAWRGIALWQSSRRQQKIWFILLLFVNSAGILPIIYLIICKLKENDRREDT